MAEEIKLAMLGSPHRVTNARCTWDHMTLTNNLFMPGGWRFRDGEATRLNLYLPAIPSEIHATTPAGKIRIRWVTASASANACRFLVALSDVNPDVDTYDPAAFDFSLAQTDTSGGAGVANTRSWDITGASLTAGRELIGYIERDALDAGDTLAADVVVTSILFVADKA